ncbi:MAG: hypothetical protein ACLT98_06880 [Eggerthellaceae bacterium]
MRGTAAPVILARDLKLTRSLMGHDWIGDVPDELLRDLCDHCTASCSATQKKLQREIAEQADGTEGGSMAFDFKKEYRPLPAEDQARAHRRAAHELHRVAGTGNLNEETAVRRCDGPAVRLLVHHQDVEEAPAA